MKLELGKTYRTRDGQRVTLTRVSSNGDLTGRCRYNDFREDCEVAFNPETGRFWANNVGYHRPVTNHQLDIVAEVPSEPMGYLVTWSIDIEATSPEAAAEMAREIQRDPTSTANVFEVRRQGQDEVVRVDLDDLPEDTEARDKLAASTSPWEGASEPAASPVSASNSETEAIPHADLIRAVLDGKTVQFWSENRWWDGDNRAKAIKLILDYPGGKYRLKPEPEVRYLAVYIDAGGDVAFSIWHNRDKAQDVVDAQAGRLHCIEIDPDSLAVTVKEET